MVLKELFIKGWSIYLLKGKTNKAKKIRYYIGSTNDLIRREKDHQLMKTSFGRLTGGNCQIVWFLKCSSQKEARSLERKVYKKYNVKERKKLEKEFQEKK